MAKGKKTGGRDIKKGEVKNPYGAGAHNPIVKAARKLSKEKVAEIIDMITMTPTDQIVNLKGKNNSFLEDYLLKGLVEGFKRGDLEILLKVLERVVGKVKEQVDHSGETTTRVIIENYVSKKGSNGD